MSRKSVNHPNSMVAPKEFLLTKNWDKKLKIDFSKSQKKEIEEIAYHYIERYHFNERRLSFDDIEYRMNNIIDGAAQILKGFPYPHPRYSSDEVHVLIEQELEFKLSNFYNGNFSETPSLIMHHVSILREAAVAALNDLKDSHPKMPKHRHPDENKNWFIYDLGSYYEQCGGKFSMPKSPGPKHQFYNFILAINKNLPKLMKLSDSEIINRSRDRSKIYRDNQNR